MPFDPWGGSWGGAWGSSWLQPDPSSEPVDPDLTVSIRDAIVAEAAITALLGTFAGEPAVFTRTPVPGSVGYPLIVINGNTSPVNEDGTNDYRPSLSYTLSVHGLNQSIPASQYRDVSTIAYLLRTLFHRQRNLSLSEWTVVDQRVTGPTSPLLTGQITTREVVLNVRVAQLAEA